MSSTIDGISMEQVEAILECPICYEVPKPPIFNCKTGHTVCGDCRKKVPNCPLCRQGFTNVRNFIAESLTDTLSYRCPYSIFGCEARVKKSLTDEHKKLCNFRPVRCEAYPCKGKQIAYAAYWDHLKNTHEVTAWRASSLGTDTKACFVTHLLMPESLTEQQHGWHYAMSCFGHTFLQYAQAVGGKIWFWVSLIGTLEEARSFRVTLTLSSKEKQLKNVWMGSAHSVCRSGEDLYLNGLCMAITEECLKAYLYRNQRGFQTYRLEIEIEKECSLEGNSALPQASSQRLLRRFARAFKASAPLIGVIAFALFCIVFIYYVLCALSDYVGRNVHVQPDQIFMRKRKQAYPGKSRW